MSQSFERIHESFLIHLILFIIFSIFFFKIDISKILLKKQNLFHKKTIFRVRDRSYSLQVFSRESSEYLQHSVLSLKKFDQLEIELEQKSRPLLGSGIPEGVRGYLNGVYARRLS